MLTCLLIKMKKTLTNRQTLSEPKPWCNDRGVLNLYHDNDVKEVAFVITQCHVVQISQSENRNSYNVGKSVGSGNSEHVTR